MTYGPGLIAFYDIWPGNGPWNPHGLSILSTRANMDPGTIAHMGKGQQLL